MLLQSSYITFPIKENQNEYITILKKKKLNLNVTLKKTLLPIKTDWWKKQYIYEKYIDNKNLSWWEKEYLINKFKL